MPLQRIALLSNLVVPDPRVAKYPATEVNPVQRPSSFNRRSRVRMELPSLSPLALHSAKKQSGKRRELAEASAAAAALADMAKQKQRASAPTTRPASPIVKAALSVAVGGARATRTAGGPPPTLSRA